MVCLRNSVKAEENGKTTTRSPFPSHRRRGRCKSMSKDASGVYIAIQSTVLTGVEMITLVERVDEMVLIGGVECVEQLVMSVCSLLRTSFRALFPTVMEVSRKSLVSGSAWKTYLHSSSAHFFRNRE